MRLGGSSELLEGKGEGRKGQSSKLHEQFPQMAADCAQMATQGFPNGFQMDPKGTKMECKSTLGRPQDGAENQVAKKDPQTAKNQTLLSPRANYERNLARPGRHFGHGWVFEGVPKS